MTKLKMERLLITGAAGALGGHCRKTLGHLAKKIRVSDRVSIPVASVPDHNNNEEIVLCDLADKREVHKLVNGCDGILHFGGQATEASWNTVRNSNIEGMYNLYEAAREYGCKRIFYASSIHAIGYHPPTKTIDDSASIRPDTLYGVSKAFGEALARMYFDKFGIETACVRIASCQPTPLNHRMLSTWFSYDDLVGLVERVFNTPILGCPIIYGVSNNDRRWADNNGAAYLGWIPQDNAEHHRKRLDDEMEHPPATSDDFNFIGGPYVSFGIKHEDNN
ncbi:MAG: NAD-dependent dehydratase [Rhodospirillaceae bacterium]|nr:NAD-dependent dehydratase [Rhodospirillaceae bacterium]